MVDKILVSVITSCYEGEEYIVGYLKNILEQTIFDEMEVLFLHVAPTPRETTLVHTLIDDYPNHFRYFLIDEREPLGITWNKGWKMANADFVAVWNIDDRRVPDSLARQVETLDENANCALTYGDYIISREAGNPHGIYVRTPPFKKNSFLSRFPSGGAFLMWRNSVVNSIGFFDEQFKTALDFEFVVRMVLAGMRLQRTEGLLGYFTDEKKGLSTREGARLTFIEETAIQLRYAMYDRIKLEYLDLAKTYKIDEVMTNGSSSDIRMLVPDYQEYCQSRRLLWKVGRVKNSIRRVFKKLGLWNTYLKVRAKSLYGAKKV